MIWPTSLKKKEQKNNWQSVWLAKIRSHIVTEKFPTGFESWSDLANDKKSCLNEKHHENYITK